MRPPSQIRFPDSVHFSGIAGRAMGGLASALARAGVRITGSDPHGYPPMSDVLRRAGIPILPGFAATRIGHKLGAVVAGSRIARGNVEIEAALTQKIPVESLPSFLSRYVLRGRERMVVAGTNGKTTTTAMLAWIFRASGREPGYLVGGQCPQLESTFELGRGAHFIMEGDEYGSSLLGDLNPKFLHYHPHSAALLNVAPDHPDFFRHPEDCWRAFRALTAQIPPDGCLVFNADDEPSMQIAMDAKTRVISVGFSKRAKQRITGLSLSTKGSRFTFLNQKFFLLLHGRAQVLNAAIAVSLAMENGISPRECALALSDFRGVEGRQELLGSSGSFVHISDAVYHPDAVRALLESVRQRFPNRRMVLIFQPRITGSRDWPAQRELPVSLSGADAVLLLPAVNPAFLDGGPPFSVRKLAASLRRQSVPVQVSSEVSVPAGLMGKLLCSGDVIVSCLQPSRRDVLIGQIDEAVKIFKRPPGCRA